MPTGSRPPRPAQRGVTYLLLLGLLALAGAALATVGQAWQQRAQRERETELLFRGLQIREALLRYAEASARGRSALPQDLEQLLRDERGAVPRHWLRQLYADPFTGRADWLLLRDARGGITGVASRSRRPALRVHGLPPEVTVPAGGAAAVGDWQFMATGPATSQTDDRRAP